MGDEIIAEIMKKFKHLKSLQKKAEDGAIWVVGHKANLRNIQPELRRVQKRIITKIDQLSDRLENGEIDIDQWYRLMSEVIAEGAGDAFTKGKGGQPTAGETRIISQFIAEQLAFLENFKSDIDKTGWLPKYRSRAQMYGTATTTPFSLGDVVRQAGRVLALPSMPAEGTICHTNCGCQWEIITIDKDRVDYDCYWRLGKNDNCQTCLQRAQDWAPVRFRKGYLL